MGRSLARRGSVRQLEPALVAPADGLAGALEAGAFEPGVVAGGDLEPAPAFDVPGRVAGGVVPADFGAAVLFVVVGLAEVVAFALVLASVAFAVPSPPALLSSFASRLLASSR